MQAVREDFVRNWVAVHAEDATNILKKPVSVSPLSQNTVLCCFQAGGIVVKD